MEQRQQRHGHEGCQYRHQDHQGEKRRRQNTDLATDVQYHQFHQSACIEKRANRSSLPPPETGQPRSHGGAAQLADDCNREQQPEDWP